MAFDAIFQPLTFRSLTVKNRVLRSNASGRFDNYDGPGNQARINGERKFARGGVGAKCLVNVVENPLGCYDLTRFPSREAIVAEIMSVFDPPPFA